MDRLIIGDELSVYFSRLFPYDYFYRWLSYGDENTFKCREFSFNFQGERFLRHQSYDNANGLKQDVRKLQPVKLDIGPVYKKQFQKGQDNNYPVQKELIFDIDVTDYDDVRTCCSGTNMCAKCWQYMIVAVKILDSALRDDFGFENILWSFSGRRGVHCWVCDPKVRFLKKYQRMGVANYLQLVTGGKFMKKKVNIRHKIHPGTRRALDVIEPVFVKMFVIDQDIFGTDERTQQFLGIVGDNEMREEVKRVLDEHCNSLCKWNAFVVFFNKQIALENEKWCKTPFLIEEIMLQYAYPRLDINVTLGMSHLLKAPFCVHPKTGKIGVTMDPRDIDRFDPYNIPTIFCLLEEIDEFDKNAKKEGMTAEKLRKIRDIEKTSLYKYLVVFEEFIIGCESAAKTDGQGDVDLDPEVDVDL